MKSRQEKIENMFYSALIGDALGCTTEFMNKEDIKNKFGVHKEIIGQGCFRIEKGCGTDDTAMIMCIVKAVNEVGLEYNKLKEEIIKQFIKWFDTSPSDIGDACFGGILQLRRGEKETIKEDRLGNGSLMRALPLAVIKSNNIDELNIMQSRLTHWNNEVDNVIKQYNKYIGNVLNEIKNDNRIDIELNKAQGRAIDTLKQAIKIDKIQDESFEEKMIKIVNMGGDTDTLGCIYGSMNIKEVPIRWKKEIDKKQNENIKEIKRFIEKFC